MMYAGYLWNHLPTGRGGIVPIELHTQAKLGSSSLNNEHTRRFLTYVLDPRLQDGKKIIK